MTPIVTTTAGRVRGFWRGEPGTPDASAAFLGIPFAKAPVGNLRFAAPEPPDPWSDVRDATAYGATALRHDSGKTLIPEPAIPGDGTLNVNVFTPDTTAALPVLVWIHGGGYTEGSPASPWYDGSRFNRDGVVTVTISYRLGFDGFGYIDGAPHNRGVRDWIAALEWVQQNISAFGGDPGQVTIAGQSAGGGAVLTLLSIPSAQHLFQRALAISAALADVPIEAARERSGRMAEAAGVIATVDGFREVDATTLHDLQSQVASAKKGISRITDVLANRLPWGPMVDGDLVPAPTIESLRDGVGSDKPLVLGATDDEFTMITDPEKEKLRWIPSALLLRPLIHDRDARHAYLEANAAQEAKGTAAMMGRYATDQIFRTVVPRVAEARREAEAATWAYRFAWVSPAMGWACHCLDVPFWFDGLDRERVADLAGENPPQSLADEMHSAAVSLITRGEPGWAEWRSDPGTTRVFIGDGEEVRNDAYDNVLALL